MIMADIRSDICAQYMDRSRFEPPSVMCWIKYDENMAPMGLSPPRKAAAIPLKPIAGTEV